MKDNNFIKKLILAAAAFIAQILIVMIIIFILLNKNIINVLTAFVLITVVFAIFVVLILNILRSIVVLLRGAIAGTASSDDKTAEKIKKVSARNDEVGEIVRNVTVAFEGITGTVAAIRNATVELEQVSEEFVAMFDTMHTVADSTNAAVTTITDNTTVQADIKVKTDSISKAVDNIQTNIEGLKESIDTLNECNNRAADIMKELITISEESGHAMDEVSNETERTNASAQEIRKVTEIIAGISNQTNLLALNASIEAARAGENGKGFAVVAEQIRELADQSRESTEHINQIVNGLIENSNISVETAKKVSEAFEKQDAKIKDTEAIFATLNSEINRVGNAVSGIAEKASDLEQHKNTIAYGVDNLAQFAEENASSGQITKENMNNLEQVMEQCKGSTDKIANVSAELVTQIKKFSGNGLKKR